VVGTLGSALASRLWGPPHSSRRGGVCHPHGQKSVVVTQNGWQRWKRRPKLLVKRSAGVSSGLSYHPPAAAARRGRARNPPLGFPSGDAEIVALAS